MESLRDLFGSFTSGIIRLAVTVGVLAAVYFFIVKPVLHTTEHVSDSVNSSIENANHSFETSFGPGSEVDKAIRRANHRVQVQIKRSVHQANRAMHHSGGGGDPEKLLHCIQRVAPDTTKMQRCTVKFAPH